MTLNNQKDNVVIVSLIFKLNQWSPVFLDLSLSPAYHTAGLWDKNCVREGGPDLLNCMSAHTLRARHFCPTTSISFFHVTVLCSSISYGFISPLPPFPSSALCSLSCCPLESLSCTHPRRSPFSSPLRPSAGNLLPSPVFCSCSPFLTLNYLFYVSSLISLIHLSFHIQITSFSEPQKHIISTP